MNEELAARFRPVGEAPDHRRGLQRGPAPPPARGGARPRPVAADPRAPLRVARGGDRDHVGRVPEGVKLTWDMFLSPVFRGYLAREGVCLFRELEDCYYNTGFLDLVRSYWGAQVRGARVDAVQHPGPLLLGGSPHIDGTRFRGLHMENTPTLDAQHDVQVGLFRRWQAKKAQVIAWYYRGRIGGGFDYWPDGPLTARRNRSMRRCGAARSSSRTR